MVPSFLGINISFNIYIMLLIECILFMNFNLYVNLIIASEGCFLPLAFENGEIFVVPHGFCSYHPKDRPI